MAEPVFEVGQVVESTGDFPPLLTKGRKYTVTEYTSSLYAGVFTWPACVTVVSDTGKAVSGHIHRFRAVQGVPNEDAA